MTGHPLDLTREQVLAHRRRAGALDARLAPGADSLRLAALAGLQDSMPRAAQLSIHARVDGTDPAAWASSPLVQVWGPRFSAYVVADEDRALFTLGRLPDDGERRRHAIAMADRLESFLAGRRMGYAEAGHAMGVPPNALRYAALTGRVLIRWDGARRPEVWSVPAPAMDPRDARRELARRHLHVLGPATAASFGGWAGIRAPGARAAFDGLATELIEVRAPIGEGWILATDEASFRTAPDRPAATRLLPSGDAYYLLHGGERALLVPDAERRGELWTSRVWPGALLVDGEVAGTWRRADAVLRIHAWRPFTAAERSAVEAEAASLPLSGLAGRIAVSWEDPPP